MSEEKMQSTDPMSLVMALEDYGYECEAGSLESCHDWQQLKTWISSMVVWRWPAMERKVKEQAAELEQLRGAAKLEQLRGAAELEQLRGVAMERKAEAQAAELEQLRGAAIAASLQKIQDKLNLQQNIQDTPGKLTVRYPEEMFHVKPAGPPPRGATTPDPGVPAVAREVFMQMIEQSPEFRRRVLDILPRPFATENWPAKTDVPRCRWAAHASAFTGQCGHFHRYVAGAPPRICPKCKNGVLLDFAVDTGIDAQQDTGKIPR